MEVVSPARPACGHPMANGLLWPIKLKKQGLISGIEVTILNRVAFGIA
jgi:hypothetical protein